MNRKIEVFIKQFIPNFALRGFRDWKLARLSKQFSDLDSTSTFDKIYRERMWGFREYEVFSGEGTIGYWADSAIADIDHLLDGQTGLTICDVGCGDFVFGRRIARLFSHYYAIDVSKYIIGLNLQKYSHISNLEFISADAANDKLPLADVYLIRQVLQHTTNDQIKKIMSNILNKKPRLVIVFEGVPTADFVANSDLLTDGSFTRNMCGSGVDLSLPPFSFPFEVFSETPHPDGIDSKLICYVFRAPID